MKPALHFSDLKRIAQSPAHCLHSITHHGSEATTSTTLGSALHSLALGGPRVVTFDGRRDKRNNDYQAFLADNGDSIILNAREYEITVGMAEALKRDRFAMDALRGRHEIPLSWTWCGRECATRGVDVDTGRCITELKTTKYAHPEWFQGEARRRGYVEQLVWYANAVEGDRELRIVAVENSAPFAVTVFRVTPELREQAERRLRLWMERFLSCEESNEWPAYVQTEVWMEAQETELDMSDLDEEEAA